MVNFNPVQKRPDLGDSNEKRIVTARTSRQRNSHILSKKNCNKQKLISILSERRKRITEPISSTQAINTDSRTQTKLSVVKIGLTRVEKTNRFWWRCARYSLCAKYYATYIESHKYFSIIKLRITNEEKIRKASKGFKFFLKKWCQI